MPFRHPDRAHDLGTRIDMEVRERLEEAVDFVCLEALVQAPAPHGACHRRPPTTPPTGATTSPT